MTEQQDVNIQDENITMDDVIATIDKDSALKRGEIVEGTVVQIDSDCVLVDIGGKSEARINLSELTSKHDALPSDIVAIGDKIKARVIETSSKEGILLSKKSVDYELRWDEIKDIYDNKKIAKALVKDITKGGLRVDFLGYPAFCPASQVWGKIGTHEKHVGETLEFEIIELSKEQRKIILSNRKVIQERKDIERKKFWDSIYEGQVREGVVKSLASYGAFVNLGGFDGMLHISEMSWNKIATPAEILKVGDTIQVYILRADPKEGKVSLSLKQILPDPWEDIVGQYTEGQIFKGTISRVAQKAAFVALGNGVEGIIPISEMSLSRINSCLDICKAGDEVEVEVIYINNGERKIALSMKQIILNKQYDEEEKALEEHRKEQEAASTVTIGELFKDLGNFATTEEKSE